MNFVYMHFAPIKFQGVSIYSPAWGKTPPMKFGISSINVSGLSAKQLEALGQKAEEVGVESFWTFEHVVVPLDYESTYPYSRDGKMPVTPETPFIDPLISLGYLAGATTTLKLATGVNIMPQVNPLLFAKQVASLDFLEGRCNS